MSPQRHPEPAPRPRWRRGVAAAVVAFVGLCQAVVTTPSVDLDVLPGWLAATIAITGFLAFLVLVGLTSLVGNVFVGILVFVLVRYRWERPAWQAILLAAPFWIVFYRVLPKPS